LWFTVYLTLLSPVRRSKGRGQRQQPVYTGIGVSNFKFPWPLHLWLVDADCAFYDPASPTESDQPISIHVPLVDAEESIATLQQFSPSATALLTNLTEARPLIRTLLSVKTHDGGHQIFGLVDCAANLDFVSEDFARRYALQTRKSVTKTPVRLANGQRVTSSTVCDVTFEPARHEFHRNFYVVRDLRACCETWFCVVIKLLHNNAGRVAS
jgi:hypothetical protein